jgi:hypothetical protein
MRNWKEDMRRLLMIAGLEEKQISFFFSDT